MEDSPEIVLRKLCCTCLSQDRKLFQLCRLTNGVNNLYLLLSYDSEAYREGFYKDTANLFICWECDAVMRRITRFRSQACAVQKQLSSVTDGRTDIKLTCLSQLSHHAIATETKIISEIQETNDNFIDCGPITDLIKSEDDDLEDIPLSELHNNHSDYEIQTHLNTETVSTRKKVEKPYKKKKKTKMKIKAKKNSPCGDEDNKYYCTTVMSEVEMCESRDMSRMGVSYADAVCKCESCIQGFNSQIELDEHNFEVHTEKDNHTQCHICLSYVENSSVNEHTDSHYQRHVCLFCDHTTYTETDILTHLKSGHALQNLTVPKAKRKGQGKTAQVLKPGSKPRRNQAMMDKRTPHGYLCTECNKYFENKNQRWKHVQRYHREGFKCQTCGKRFAFKNNLTRHEQLHAGPPPRVECDICHKMVRSDLAKVHARIHSQREQYSCAACDKRFVSRASYEHHLKYTQAHAAGDILKYKCSMCDKGYRSRGELRDHENYQHMGTTQHKCPVCGKALATRRCITRHVRRAHHGLRESARDKICQQCGKAFRDKKGLREHEFIHTGERPLSCEVCGCTFRQSASLYTHRKRVHRIHAPRRRVQLLDHAAAVG